jgi:hypothetical protein
MAPMCAARRLKVVRRRSGQTLLVAAAVIVATINVPGVAQAKPGNSPNAKACQKGGWENLATSTGESFASEASCTSYAAQGGTLTSSPYAATRDLCESLNGTFSVGNGSPVVWRCDDWSYASNEDLQEKNDRLFVECSGDGGITMSTGSSAGSADTECTR